MPCSLFSMQMCRLALFVKLKFSGKFPNLQQLNKDGEYKINVWLSPYDHRDEKVPLKQWVKTTTDQMLQFRAELAIP